MADTTVKTFDEIVSQILEKLSEAQITDMNPGSEARTVAEVFAYGLDEAWYALSQTPDQFFIDKTTGEYLDRRAAEWGITRHPGTKASGNLVLSRTTPAPFGQLIPAGTQFGLDELLYSSVADKELIEGATEVTLEVEATLVGKDHNLPAGTELKQTGVAVSLIETVTVGIGGLIGGTDAETDDALRQRLLIRIRAPVHGGTKYDYEIWATSVSGVKTARCFPLARGAGTVDVLITTEGGLPGEQLLNAVSAYIEERRPVGADVHVIGPTVVTVDVGVTITPSAGKTVASLTADVDAAIRSYINSVPVGGTVRLTGIGNAVHDIPGVDDYTITVPTANLVLTSTQLAQPGQITVS